MHKGTIYLFGILIGLSDLYHSNGELISLIVFVPITVISVGTYLDRESIKIGGLITATIAFVYFIPTISLKDTTSLSIYILTFVLPLIVYWSLILAVLPTFELKASTFAVSYFLLVLILFFALVFVLNVNEYLLAAGNEAPQALVLSASALIVFIPYHLALKR